MKMLRKYIVIVSVLTIFIIACHSRENKTVETAAGVVSEVDGSNSTVAFTPPEVVADDEVKAAVAEEESVAPAADDAIVTEKKIIKSGDISIKSRNVKQSKLSFDKLVQKHHAFYVKEGFSNDENIESYDLVINIPAANFDAFVNNIDSTNDEIINKNIQMQDVTEEFVDINARLANKKAYLERYKALLSKANSIKDILNIQEQIRVLQEEIESSEGRLKYLSHEVTFSTLNVWLYREKEYVYKPQQQDSFFERLKSAISSGWSSIINCVLWFFESWPIILSLPVVYFIFKRIRKIRRKRNSQVNS